MHLNLKQLDTSFLDPSLTTFTEPRPNRPSKMLVWVMVAVAVVVVVIFVVIMKEENRNWDRMYFFIFIYRIIFLLSIFHRGMDIRIPGICIEHSHQGDESRKSSGKAASRCSSCSIPATLT